MNLHVSLHQGPDDHGVMQACVMVSYVVLAGYEQDVAALNVVAKIAHT
jgi:hypothetical protein